jgi:hypothetical protein
MANVDGQEVLMYVRRDHTQIPWDDYLQKGYQNLKTLFMKFTVHRMEAIKEHNRPKFDEIEQNRLQKRKQKEEGDARTRLLR